ncbi:MAG: pyrroline-5-carboxylate reductase [Candidatus Sumerlaeia bacterium]
MAEALIGGLIEAGVVARPDEIAASDVRPERLRELGQRFGISISQSNAGVLSRCATIVFAVKPQNMPGVLDEVAAAVGDRHLLITICAGVSTRFVERRIVAAQAHRVNTPCQPRVVRAMPNTPALIRRGAAALCRGAHASDEDLASAEAVFRAVGITVRLDEEHLNAVTALSGSGPAYFFRLMEDLIAAGEREGLPREAAAALVVQTAVGAAAMAAESGQSPAALREMVTSPQGTTWAALEVFKARGFSSIVADAIRAATARAAELGRDE